MQESDLPLKNFDIFCIVFYAFYMYKYSNIEETLMSSFAPEWKLKRKWKFLKQKEKRSKCKICYFSLQSLQPHQSLEFYTISNAYLLGKQEAYTSLKRFFILPTLFDIDIKDYSKWSELENKIKVEERMENNDFSHALSFNDS